LNSSPERVGSHEEVVARKFDNVQTLGLGMGKVIIGLAP
jgi:hypothetical protein